MLFKKNIIIPFIVLLLLTLLFVILQIVSLSKDLQLVATFIYSISVIGLVFLLIYNIKILYDKAFDNISNTISKGIESNFQNEIKLDKVEDDKKLNILIEKLNTSYSAVLNNEKENKKTTERFKNQFEYLKFSNEIGRFILSKLTVKKIIIDVYNELGIIFPMNTFSIGLIDSENNNLNLWKINAINNKLQQNTESLLDGDSLSVFCIKNTQEIFINDYKKEHKKYHISVSNTISLNKSMIYLPLISLTDRTIGVMSVKSKKVNTYQDYHLEIFRNLSSYIVTALENSRVYKQLEDKKNEIGERNEELNQQREEIININENLTEQKEKLENALRDIELLSKIGQDITASIETAEITKIVHINLEKLINAPFFGIGIYDGKSKLIFKNVIEKNHFLPEFSADIFNNDTIATWCFNNFKEVLINDKETESVKYLGKAPKPIHDEITDSIIYLPLATKGEKLGVVTVQAYKKNAYSEHDLFIFKSLASYISIAISNANAFELIEKKQAEIQALASQLESQFDNLQESESKMTNMINLLPDPLMGLDNNGKLIIWNKSMEILTGILAKDILGAENFEYSLAFYDERRPMLADILLNPAKKFEEKYNLLNQSNNTISGQAYVSKLKKHLWGTAGLLFDKQGNTLGAIQISKDITEVKEQNDKIKEANKLLSNQNDEIEKQKEEILKKQAELHEIVEELQVTNKIIEDTNKDLERLSLVASKTDNAVIILDNDANITWVNEGFTRLYDYNQSQFIRERGINWMEASYNSEMKDIITETITTKKSSFYISKIEKGIYDTKWAQSTLTPIYDESDELKNFIIVQTDITESKEAEKEIAVQNKKIRNSIKYARRIQSAVLPQRRFIERTLAEHFILYKPRDIVSGDFYWISRKKTKLLIAAADSTGHGVPGAFMSMLGMSFLNEIANKFFEKSGVEGLQAGKILNQLRTEVIRSLHQKRNTETKDGIDIALFVFDLDTQKIQYAGANNPLYLVRKKDEEALDIDTKKFKTTENENTILYQIIADKMPIGITNKAVDGFENKEFRVKNGDKVYLFSDGYIDQFGGEKRRKFLSSNFRKLLLNIYDESMTEQEKILDNSIKDWMSYPKLDGKPHSQIDDILVMGLKF